MWKPNKYHGKKKCSILLNIKFTHERYYICITYIAYLMVTYVKYETKCNYFTQQLTYSLLYLPQNIHFLLVIYFTRFFSMTTLSFNSFLIQEKYWPMLMAKFNLGSMFIVFKAISNYRTKCTIL